LENGKQSPEWYREVGRRGGAATAKIRQAEREKRSEAEQLVPVHLQLTRRQATALREYAEHLGVGVSEALRGLLDSMGSEG
jgi:hypothetical protein